MMNDFRNGIANARSKKQLDRILKQAREAYGFLSKEYNEILSLCWDRLDTL